MWVVRVHIDRHHENTTFYTCSRSCASVLYPLTFLSPTTSYNVIWGHSVHTQEQELGWECSDWVRFCINVHKDYGLEIQI